MKELDLKSFKYNHAYLEAGKRYRIFFIDHVMRSIDESRFIDGYVNKVTNHGISVSYEFLMKSGKPHDKKTYLIYLWNYKYKNSYFDIGPNNFIELLDES